MLRVESSKWMRRFSQLRSVDWILVLAIFTLLALGFAAIYSVELSQEVGSVTQLQKQLLAFIVGAVGFFVMVLSNYKSLQNYALLAYIAGLLLLVLVLFLGKDIRGSLGWFSIGGFSFQPVEFMKISLILALSTFFSKKARGSFGLRTFVESLIVTALPVGLVMLQPDFGSASVLVGIWFGYILFAGIPWRYVAGLGVLGAGFFALAWKFFFAEYQRARILTFLDPSLDPLGQGYNVTQAIIAIGSGGWIGSGLGFGTQSQLKFLPESQTDFIFAVIAEELGFLGVMMVLLAFCVAFWRIGRIIPQSRDNFTAYLAVGVCTVLFIQFLVNIGMNLGLFPVTGIGLPFVSYGGSSLIGMLILLGIVQSIAVRSRGGNG